MRDCYAMYNLNGMQFCMHPSFSCKYHGKVKEMSILINKQLNTGDIVCCDLNLFGSEFVDDFESLEDVIQEDESERI